MKVIKGGVTAPKGFKASGIACGIKKSGKKDLALIYSEVSANAAAVFTSNRVKAAPILLSQEHIKGGKARAIVANSGCANACTGKQGIEDALVMANSVASLFNIDPRQVLVASTGSIGSRLPMRSILGCVRSLAKKVSVEGAEDAALAILTTDTRKKEIAVQVKVGGRPVTIGGIAKGSGMIAPNMATMFAFITTDTSIPSIQLKFLLKDAVNKSFNMTVVDKDTSTNDCVFLLANGMAKNRFLIGKDEKAFKEALEFVCVHLAKEIARDGEGATKLIEVRVSGSRSLKDAKLAAKGIVGSDLVKSAIFGADPNFGRIMAALGYSGAEFDPDIVNVFIGGSQVVRAGVSVGFNQAAVRRYMKGSEVEITVMLGQGTHMATAWGCDLTYDYVKINAEYHT